MFCFLCSISFSLCTQCRARAAFAALSRRWNVCPGGAGLPSCFMADIIFYCQIKIPGSAGFIATICAAHPILTGSLPLTARSIRLPLLHKGGGPHPPPTSILHSVPITPSLL
ncbi:hypothetical protein XENTR_v10011499 [Xenopus tropicalis]|nr:hypothetical protein XENTR_v10011499 [Xenopus tropicalis]